MPHDPYQELYIHLPFCRQRCLYCDFTTSAVPQDDPAIDSYIEGIIGELRALSKAGELTAIKTVYLGGGTPSYIGSKRLTSLLYFLSLCLNLGTVDEVTMEANPESLTEEMVRDIWALGVNRLSIGVQSFDDDVLAMLGRVHDAERACSAIRTVRTRFENVSVDLMCGIPGQSGASLRASLEEAVSLDATHVSIYPLTIEEGSPLDRLVLQGRFDEPDPDTQAAHMEIAGQVLGSHGFRRYEVANYALPGFESRHNLGYWSGVPYLGVGRSATTMTQNAERRMRKQDGIIVDDLGPREMAAEDLMLAMRKADGVADGELARASALLPDAPGTFKALMELGLVEHADGRWRPTERGWLCGNELYGRIWDLAG